MKTKAFQAFKSHLEQRLIAQWPEWAPPMMRHLSRRQVARYIRAGSSMDGMPDAELTPLLVELRNLHREFLDKSYEANIGMGKIFLELQRRFRCGEFGSGSWEETLAAWLVRYAPKTRLSIDDAEFAMRTAAEEAQ